MKSLGRDRLDRLIEEPDDEFLQRSQLVVINETELAREINKMLETCVEMGVGTESTQLVKMSRVNVSVYAKQSLVDGFHSLHVVLGEFCIYSHAHTWPD